MSELNITLEQVRGLIGYQVRYQGVVYEIIEVLEDGPSIVLMASGEKRVIQPNLYGDPTRRVPETLTVPVLSPDRNELSAQFLSLDLIEEE